jgi:hypothetical protein
MRLTLRTMLAYLHGHLAAADAEEIGQRIGQSDFARQLLGHIKSVTAATIGGQTPTDAAEDANTLAEYLDNALSPAAVAEFEKQCLESDERLAELVAAHQIMVHILSEPARLDDPLRLRLHGLIGASAASSKAVAAPQLVPAPPAIRPPPVPPAPPMRVMAPPVIIPPLVAVLAVLSPVTAVPILPVSALAPAAVELPALGGASIAAKPVGPSWRQRHFGPKSRPWMVSLAIHQVLIILLGLWILPVPGGQAVTQLWATFTSVDETRPMEAMSLQTESMVTPPLTLDASSAVALPRRNAIGGEPDLASPTPGLAAGNMLPLDRADESKYATGTSRDDSPPAKTSVLSRPMRKRSSAAAGGVVAAEGVEGAVDGVLSSIRGELAAEDLLVVWLLDASLSLYDDRQIVAAQIEPFYREIDGRQAQSHLLMNAAVAFGDTTLELVEPIRFGQKIVDAVAQVPIDNTGLENVMTSVEHCVTKYRKRWKGALLIVVWTDESGDDTLQLEETIALCRQQRVVVSVVGPSSVFGTERGFHPYLDRGTGYRFLLPIKRGPDTSFAERPLLGYWHDSDLAPWSKQGAQIDQNVPWYGGLYREGLLSGVGPYALTRLALETGGTFTLLDHAYSAGPFRLEAMKRYLPDYGPASEYLRQLKYHPLRQAVLDVVQLTYQEQAKLMPPTFAFVSERYDYYPFSIHHVYMTANDFRTSLKDAFTIETAHVVAGSEVIERAVARFGVAGMEKEYQKEESPRWRAWYDLTRGRMLALSVRHFEYLLTCQFVFERTAFLNPETNRIVFHPSSQLKSDRTDVRERALEAERLLKRCVAQNPGTPWAYLAQWELDRPLGLDVEQVVIPPPRGGSPLVPRAPVPTLPNF